MAPIRLAHLVSHPIPYEVPLYRELARRPEVELTVYYYSDASVRGYQDVEFGRHVAWDTPLLEGYHSRFLPSAAGARIQGRWGAPLQWDLLRTLHAELHDVIWLHSYAHANAVVVAAVAPARGVRVLIREDQTLLHERARHLAVSKRVLLRALFARTWGLYTGEESRRHFLHYGMPPERLSAARHCVDNGFFQARATELRPQREALRGEFGIDPDLPLIVSVAKLIPKKGPLVLIEAFERLRTRHPCALLLVGDGSQHDEAAALVEARGIPDVRFAGFLNQSEVPAAYAAADVFCLASVLHETWGLVVNEAMNFGLPVVVTDKVGSAPDLVRPERNGFVVPSGDPESLASALETLVTNDSLRARFGEQSRCIVDEYSIEACADGIIVACAAPG